MKNRSSQSAPKPYGSLEVTELEYQTAMELSRASSTSAEDAAAYYQLTRYYRGQIFDREQVEKALRKMRGEWVLHSSRK